MPTGWGQSDKLRRLLNGGRSPSRSPSPPDRRAERAMEDQYKYRDYEEDRRDRRRD